jgi:hypothetical protein
MPTKRKSRKTMRTRQSASRAAPRSAKPTSRKRLRPEDVRERELVKLLELGLPLDAQRLHDLDALVWIPKRIARIRRELCARARIQAVRDTDAIVGRHSWRYRM